MVDYHCPNCDSVLYKLEYYKSRNMSRELWNSLRLGDYMCKNCKDVEGRHNSFFWEKDLEKKLEKPNPLKQSN